MTPPEQSLAPAFDDYYEQVPDYMTEVYDWAYVNPAWVRQLDRNIVVKTLLFGQDQRLMRAYLNEIEPGMRVWQVAHVYGDLVRRAAEKAGEKGAFHLTDITPIQIEHGAKKLQGLPQARIFWHDAATFEGVGEYDLICSFFLLHEVPDDKKRRILDHLLAKLPAHGKLILVDYHRPALWQPIRYILQLVNRTLEPFARAVWDHELAYFAREADRFNWKKRTIFGGVYQIVTVTHKAAR